VHCLLPRHSGGSSRRNHHVSDDFSRGRVGGFGILRVRALEAVAARTRDNLLKLRPFPRLCAILFEPAACAGTSSHFVPSDARRALD
jgi:hypothetical protein